MMHNTLPPPFGQTTRVLEEPQQYHGQVVQNSLLFAQHTQRTVDPL